MGGNQVYEEADQTQNAAPQQPAPAPDGNF